VIHKNKSLDIIPFFRKNFFDLAIDTWLFEFKAYVLPNSQGLFLRSGHPSVK